MIELKATMRLVMEAKPARRYSNSLLSIAAYPWYVPVAVPILDLADELQRFPQVLVLTVVDSAEKVVGIVQRERLFSLVGKPFGRDVLSRSLIGEIAEPTLVLDGRTNIFAADDQPDSADRSERRDRFIVLTDEQGRFQSTLGFQDLDNYLAAMTREDVELAGRLQERLMAGADLRQRKDNTIQAWSRAAKGVGGDFYFVRELADGRVFAALCDVSGKGVAASIIVAMVWGLLRGFDYQRGLRELLINLNMAVVSTFHMEKYLTGFFMIYDPSARKVLCADMGHSHVLFLRGGVPTAVRGSRQNLPIGIDYQIDPALLGFTVKDGDILLAYSDGIVEQEDAQEQEFGEQRLVDLIRRSLDGGVALQDALPAEMDRFRGGTPQHDDMSFLLFSVQAGVALTGGEGNAKSRPAGARP